MITAPCGLAIAEERDRMSDRFRAVGLYFFDGGRLHFVHLLDHHVMTVGE